MLKVHKVKILLSRIGSAEKVIFLGGFFTKKEQNENKFSGILLGFFAHLELNAKTLPGTKMKVKERCMKYHHHCYK